MLVAQDTGAGAEASLVEDDHIGDGAVGLEAAVRPRDVPEIGLTRAAGQVKHGRSGRGPGRPESGETHPDDPAAGIGAVFGDVERPPLEFDRLASRRAHRGRFEHDVAGLVWGGGRGRRGRRRLRFVRPTSPRGRRRGDTKRRDQERTRRRGLFGSRHVAFSRCFDGSSDRSSHGRFRPGGREHLDESCGQ